MLDFVQPSTTIYNIMASGSGSASRGKGKSKGNKAKGKKGGKSGSKG